MTELINDPGFLPCPFCWGKNLKIIHYCVSQELDDPSTVKCLNCNASGPLKFLQGNDAKSVLSKAWNERK